MNYTENDLRNIINGFTYTDLKTLLKTFNQIRTGPKAVLRDTCLDLLCTKPPRINNFPAYIAKIIELYHVTISYQFYANVILRQRLYRSNPYPRQQQMRIGPRLSSLQRMRQNQPVGNYRNANFVGNNDVQYNYQPVAHDVFMQVNQPRTIRPLMPNVMLNVKFKKLPFFEVLDEICPPTLLSGALGCSLQHISFREKNGMHQATFNIPMNIEQINYISLHRNLRNVAQPYYNQLRIRICLLEQGSTEASDYFPVRLYVRINDTICPLPSTPNKRKGIEARKVAEPIHCSDYLKLNPTLLNTVTFNWVPDGKKYIWGAYLVRNQSSDFLIQQLLNRKPTSSEDTKNNIIKNLADMDPELATTSYRFPLICPLSKIRLKIPAKSIYCDHLQCFDAYTFILMNEKKPTWLCPTCNKACNYDDIRVESYFLDIIRSSSLSDSCTEVEILGDGSWRAYVEPERTDSVVNAQTPVEYIDLDDSDEGENAASFNVPSVVKKETPIDVVYLVDDSDEDENYANSRVLSKKKSNLVTKEVNDKMVKLTLIDLTSSDGESETEAADATLPATSTVTQAQLQQDVTSSEQEDVMEIADSPL